MIYVCFLIVHLLGYLQFKFTRFFSQIINISYKYIINITISSICLKKLGLFKDFNVVKNCIVSNCNDFLTVKLKSRLYFLRIKRIRFLIK